MIVWGFVLLGIALIGVTIAGIRWAVIFRGNDLTLVFMVGIVCILIGLAWSNVFGDPAERLGVRMENDSRDPIHINVTFNGALVINENLAPPQWWFNWDDDHVVYLHKADIGDSAGELAISINGAKPAIVSGDYGKGDYVDIRVNADVSISVTVDGEIVEVR